MEKLTLNNYKNYFKLEDHISKTVINHHFSLYRELADINQKCNNIEYCSSPENSFPNFIFNENDNYNLNKIQELIKSNELPPFWITNKKTTVSEINKNGFKLIRAWPLLTMTKSELIEPRKVEGFKLIKVITNYELNEWKDIVEAEYNYNFNIKTLENWLNKTNIDFFIGKVNNNIVSATLNFIQDKIVGSHLTATKKEYRKKGIGMQTVYHALNHAFNNGSKKSIASSTELGINAWKKIGYNVLDDKLYINWFLETHTA